MARNAGEESAGVRNWISRLFGWEPSTAPDEATTGGAIDIRERDGPVETLSRPDEVKEATSQDDGKLELSSSETQTSSTDFADLDQGPTLKELVLGSDCGARLRKRAIHDPLFERWTVNSAREKPEKLEFEALAVEGLGQRSVDELLQIVSEWRPNEQTAPLHLSDFGAISQGEPHTSRKIDDLPEEVLDTPVVDAIHYFGPGRRLLGALSRLDLAGVTVRDYLSDCRPLVNALAGLSGVGERTITEARELIERFITGHESRFDGAGGNESGLASETGVAVINGATSLEMVENALKVLPARDLDVVRGRYGLDRGRPKTLNQLGAALKITRERVRQLEKRALERLRTPDLRSSFSAYLRENGERMWSVMAGDNDLVTEDEFVTNRQLLDPLDLLSVDIVFGDLESWLATKAHKTAEGWLRSSIDPIRFADAIRRIENLASALPSPTPLAALTTMAEFEPALFDAALEGSSRISVFEGYVVAGRISSVVRRTIRLHRLASERFGDRPFDIVSLTLAFREADPGEDCGSRLLLSCMNDSKHLFSRIQDGTWHALIEAPLATAGLPAASLVETRRLEERAGTGNTIQDRIVSALGNGPMRQTDLRSVVVEGASGAIAEASVGAIIATSPVLRRVAPGVVALPGDVPVRDGNEQILEAFQGERPCRIYCFARYGGAPIGWHAAWTAEHEMALAEWARENVSRELFGSLLTVIEPDCWPCSDELVDDWRLLRRSKGAWLIGQERCAVLGSRQLDPDRFLALLAQLAFFGWTNWIAINRCLETRPDQHNACDLLAVLAKADLVTPPDDWQARHSATPLVREMFIEACSERRRGEAPSWERGVLAAIREHFEDNADRSPDGWIPASEFREAIDVWMSGELDSARPFGSRGRLTVDPDPIFDTDEWDALFRLS